jgi:3-(methylthio)propanoyl-CoA dehydrogenase
MFPFAAPVRDLRFVLEELLEHRSLDLPGFEEATPDLVEAVLEEAAKLAGEVWAPLNASGDRQGCVRREDGGVTLPDGFAEAYQAYVEGGWNGIGVSEALGGQGLPEVVASSVQEMLHGANMALGLCPMLTAGAIEALAHHGSDALKETYLPRLVEGSWTGTMNLTEPQAGSDLSKVRTRAVPQEDGSYRLFGQKIFITWGEHDAAENIIHLVLARTPDAPEGNKGISLFLVPKYLVNEPLVNQDGSLGERNDVTCASIEHKLGIHGSPTCTLSFGEGDGAIGYLVGEEGRGLNHMFTMMNEARHKVGIQGIGVAERACQHAFAYALDRTQGRSPRSGRDDCTISDHLDVRRMLLSMRARTDALRALALYCAAQLDVARHGAAGEREVAQSRADVLIPVVKAFSTDQAVEIASLGVQVHGGMGFIEETGAAQLLRDARIAPIYEGTNGIQALDLAGRKLSRDGGAALAGLIEEVKATASELTENVELAAMGESLAAGATDLEAAMQLVLEAGRDPEQGADAIQAYATPFLSLAGHVLCAWQMGRAALRASAALGGGSSEPFYQAKLAAADFALRQWLPVGRANRSVIEAGMASLAAFQVTAS